MTVTSTINVASAGGAGGRANPSTGVTNLAPWAMMTVPMLAALLFRKKRGE